MKTFVLHPEDPTTEFLKEIYLGRGWTFENRWNVPAEELMEKIKAHDRIIMMGHGTPVGLIGYSNTFMRRDFVELLKTKQCICIWCNADQYVLREGINGFYTGMFISEVSEASHYGIRITQAAIDRSNRDFAFEMKLCLDHDDPKLIYEEIKKTYVGPYSVYQFNNDRLYYRNDVSQPIIL